jgi:predicted SnoaL-like aldol condensation-catalyzing enzyme
MSNKQLFLDAFARFAAGDIEVLRTVVREDFVEHSPGNPSGRDAWVDFIAASPVAKARLELAHVIADDDHVVVHYRMVAPDGTDTAVVDIWRYADGLITEHWDVVAPSGS